MGTWAGKRKEAAESEGSSRQGLGLLGAWTGLGRKDDEATELSATTPRRSKKSQAEEDDDDRHIRFIIGGQGRRMNKEDFLKEMQSLDPKSRKEVIDKSDAPAALKDMARKDSSTSTPSLFGAKLSQLGASQIEAEIVGTATARHAGVGSDSDGSGRHKPTDRTEPPGGRRAGGESLARHDPSAASPSASTGTFRNLPKTETPSTRVPETASERRQREQALKGVIEKPEQPTMRETPAERRRREATSSLALATARRSTTSEYSGESSSMPGSGEVSPTTGETPAEKRRREAALGLLSASGDTAEDEDSEDDNTVRVPPARTPGQASAGTGRGRGIRFAEEPIRGRRAQFESLKGARGPI
jgi:sodium/hydrogen antiporter